MDYEVFKKKIEENKPKLVLAACFILVFLVGFGVGRFDKNIRKDQKNQINYNIKNQPQPAVKVQNQSPVVTALASSTPASSSCIVKGNLSSSGKKIYHVAGGAFYKTVKPEQCFNTEAEALAAGFVKSQR